MELTVVIVHMYPTEVGILSCSLCPNVLVFVVMSAVVFALVSMLATEGKTSVLFYDLMFHRGTLLYNYSNLRFSWFTSRW